MLTETPVVPGVVPEVPLVESQAPPDVVAADMVKLIGAPVVETVRNCVGGVELAPARPAK